jgi:threonine/homoserine/homoserine lactone efflux protein
MLQIIQNIILGLSFSAMIGPVSIEVIKRGLKNGFLPAFLLGLGATAADTTYLLLIYLGLSNFFNIPVVKTILWFFGALILLYLGYLSIKEYFDKIDLKKSNPKAGKNSFITGYLMTISNPMTIVLWLGVFGAIIASSNQNLTKIVALLNTLTVIIGVLLWFFILSLLLHWGKRFINEKSINYISLIAGIVIIGFGLYFGYNAIISII